MWCQYGSFIKYVNKHNLIQSTRYLQEMKTATEACMLRYEKSVNFASYPACEDVASILIDYSKQLFKIPKPLSRPMLTFQQARWALH
jgi:hypothetical protein